MCLDALPSLEEPFGNSLMVSQTGFIELGFMASYNYRLFGPKGKTKWLRHLSDLFYDASLS